MTKQTFKQAFIAGAVALALGVPAIAVADDSTNSKTTSTTSSSGLTGKEKATAIGAGTGAVAGAVVGGPVGAVIGAGVGGYVGNKGTDANGHVESDAKSAARSEGGAMRSDGKVRSAQAALNERGYNLAIDGVYGPNTASAVRSFQGSNGLAQTGTLDDETLNRLGVKG